MSPCICFYLCTPLISLFLNQICNFCKIILCGSKYLNKLDLIVILSVKNFMKTIILFLICKFKNSYLITNHFFDGNNENLYLTRECLFKIYYSQLKKKMKIFIRKIPKLFKIIFLMISKIILKKNDLRKINSKRRLKVLFINRKWKITGKNIKF